MGRQVNFFLHPDDQKDFDDLLKTFDDICFLSYYHKSNNPTVINDTIMLDHIKEGSRVHLVRRQDLELVKLNFVEKFNYRLIDNTASPVLDFDRCVVNENDLRRGRLYFQPKYFENLKWIEKDINFIKWSDNIIAKTKKYFKKFKYKYEQSPYEYIAYLSPNSMRLLLKNNAMIGLTGDRLTIK
jgi:hypothetical protein